MAGKIPREFIDDLINRSDIVDIVDSRVKLKKAGRNYQACCPFHNEKTPSFTVSQEKQFYHCFGCGAHGNAISFLMEYDRLEFVEAIEELAKIHGLEVPREKGARPAMSSAQKQQLEDDYVLMDKVAKFFQHQLFHHPDAQKAKDYLKNRGLSGDIVKQWQIGYAPASWDSVLKQFGASPKHVQQLIDLKLVNQNDQGRRFDFFRDRIMFPIRDRRGRVIGFGGRILDGDGPKYLNSPETRIFHKGNELYGFYQAKQANRSLDSIIIVEGYMDVVALSQFGITTAVAALGTSTTPDHMNLLMRSCSNIICCYDGDRAGRDAAWRALENALPAWKDNVKLQFLFLPDGEDPDTMVRKVGPEGFGDLLNSALPLSKFFFDHMFQTHDVGSLEGKAALKAAALPMIDSIPGEHQLEKMKEELSKITGEYDRYKLQQDISKANQSSSKPSRSGFDAVNKARQSPVRMLMRLLLDNPQLASLCPDVQPSVVLGMQVAGIELLCDVHQYCSHNPTANTAQLIEHYRDRPEAKMLSKLLLMENLVQQEDETTIYADSFAKLIDWSIDNRFETLIQKARVNSLTAEEKAELNLLTKERLTQNRT